MGGYFQSTSFEDAVLEAKGQPITFYDSVTGKPLFVAPLNRSPEEFIRESEIHGWPSFRDEEVVWENVRVLKTSGETVSVDGTYHCTVYADFEYHCIGAARVLDPQVKISCRISNNDVFTCLSLSNPMVAIIVGTHLGHNLPDKRGNRYCINLVSVAGKPNTA